MRFPAFCTRIPHMTASSSDFPIEFLLYMCACMCHFFRDEGSLRGCRNIWITISVSRSIGWVQEMLSCTYVCTHVWYLRTNIPISLHWIHYFSHTQRERHTQYSLSFFSEMRLYISMYALAELDRRKDTHTWGNIPMTAHSHSLPPQPDSSASQWVYTLKATLPYPKYTPDGTMSDCPGVHLRGALSLTLFAYN